jgi:outer membrane protein TolC
MSRPLISPRRAIAGATTRAALALACVTLAVTPRSVVAQTTDTLHLAALQRAALARDPRSAQAALLREQTALRLANLRAERFPTVSVNSQAQYQSDVTSVPFPGAVMPYKDTYDANLGTRVRLIDPARAPRSAAERAQLAEAEARLEVALHAQRQAVNDAFFSALLLDAQRAVLADAITDLEAQLRLARERSAAGAALPSEPAMLEAELLRRQQSLEEVVTGRAVALSVLGDLTGRRVGTGAAIAAPELAAPVRAARSAMDSLRRRPEYAQFAAGREVVAARESAMGAQERPRVSAFGRTGYGRPGLNQLAREFDSYWLAGVQLEWMPFDWGTVRREREALALQRQVLVTEERAFAERIARAVTADLATVDRLERAVAADDAIVVLRERVLAETRLRYTEGVITAAEFVDRETDLSTARLTRATHRVELAQARARFLTTVGLEVR